MFKKVLVANRGEIAVRVIAALKELGIRSVAIYSEPDQDGRHVQLADESVQLVGQPAKVYLDAPQIVKLAKEMGAEAVHPGYGFLSENPEFAQLCLDAGLKFIGPKPEVIRRMGSKVEARQAMSAAAVPVVPGTTDAVTDAAVVKQLATKYGYPIAIKASAGGGGRGLKVVRSEGEVDNALAAAQREGASYFGSSEVYVEKYLDHPHHIEVQVIGDEHGNVIHLGERDCSSQRRHQKLLEETPGPKLKPQVRKALLDAAVAGAKSLNYSSAGTLEFLVADDDFYFLEVNTRVQVEHPITEMVTGVDIVKEQILVAAGHPLSIKQEEVVFRGHSIEFRINAEDPYKQFMPSPGTIHGYQEPRWPWVRVDSACYGGYSVLPFYDSLLAKLVVWGRTREEAIARGKLALSTYRIEGVSTTIPFHLALLDDPQFLAGEVDTKYVEAHLLKEFMAKGKPPEVVAAAAAKPAAQSTAGGAPNSKNGTGEHAVQRIGPRAFEVQVDQKSFKVAVTELADKNASLADAPALAAKPQAVGGRSLGARPTAGAASKSGANGGEVRAAMHGLVKELMVKEGDAVAKGQKLLIFEAMKMESEVMSDRDGLVSKLHVKSGQTVESDAVMLVLSQN
ncbi:MAG TPA: acetyl-CoA carboxylase biotin carboxylase subunit [Planktothrix sp.]|jgi:acetyl-CoA/propionyl-CoA carboxylase biotin carboxyl carrier protein